MSTKYETLRIKTNKFEYARQFCKLFPEVLKDDLADSNWDDLEKEIKKKKNGESTFEIYSEPLLVGFSGGDTINKLVREYAITVPESTIICDYSRNYDNTSESEQWHYEFKDQKLTLTSFFSACQFPDDDECESCGKLLREQFAYYYYVPDEGLVCPKCGNIILPEEDMEVSKEVEEMKDGVFPERNAL